MRNNQSETSTKAGWRPAQFMDAVGIKSRQTFDYLVKTGDIPTVKIGKMRVVIVSPHDWLARKAREQSPVPPKRRGRPAGQRAPSPENRPNRLGRPPGAKDKRPRRRAGAAQQPAEPMPLAAASE